jgi:prevent-host-death family protein
LTEIGTIERLAPRLPELVGSPLSYNNLREDLGVAHATVVRWVDIESITPLDCQEPAEAGGTRGDCGVRVAFTPDTARDLKNRTGDALRAVGRGEQVLVTRRGRPFALVVPAVTGARDADDQALLDTLRRNALEHRVPFSSYEEFSAWRRGSSSSTPGRSSSTSRSRVTRGRG